MAIGNPINLTSNVEGKNISVIATAGQTQFTITGGYRINQISVFRNGVRLVDGRDFTALDGTIVTLLSAATVADVIEFQVFDDFRVSDALSVNSGGTVNGNVTVTGILSTTNLSIGSSISLDATTGIITAVQVIGGTITGTATTAINAQGLTGTPDITVNNIVAAAGTFSGVLTYEDVTNIDSLGIVTARTGVDITANGLVVNAGVSTFGADLSIADKIIHSGDTNTAIRFPSNDTFTVETSGVQRLEVDSTGDLGLVGIATATGLVVVAGSGGYAGHTGIITAVTFDGNVTGNISGGTVAGSTGTFTGDVDIADKIVHTGDTNTAIRFPAADTFTVETAGSERVRVTSAGSVGIGTASVDRQLHVLSSNGTVAHFESGNANTISQIVFEGLGASAPPNLGATGNDLHFTTNNTERLRITSAGNITAVNTASGGQSVTLKIGASNSSGANAGNIIINNGGTGDGALQFDYESSAARAKIYVYRSTEDLIFDTAGSEALRIDSSQRLLIGETSAVLDTSNALLQIGAAAGANMVLYRDDSSVTTDDSLGLIRFYSNAGSSKQEHARITATAGAASGDGDKPGNLLFYTTADGASSPTERLRIDSSGHLIHTGLRAGGGENKLAILSTLSHNTNEEKVAVYIAENEGSSNQLTFGGGSSSYNAATTLRFMTASAVDTTAGTERLRIDSSGRLLVSATVEGAPAADNLTLEDSGDCGLTIRAGTSNYSTIYLSDATSGTGEYAGSIQYGHADNSFRIGANSVERVRITSAGNLSLVGDNQKLLIGAGDDLEIYHDGSNSYIKDSGTGRLLVLTSGFRVNNAANNENIIHAEADGAVELYHDNSKKFETTSAGVTVTGTVSDSIGPLRRLGVQGASSSFTLAADHAGKIVRMTGSGQTITIPNDVFTAGDMITVFNVGTGTLTFSAAGTLYNIDDGANGNRVMAAKGMATLVCTASNEFAISGSQLS